MSIMETNKIMYMPVHPCEIIKDELKARGMKKKEFAQRMGMQQSNVSRLFRGENAITIELARKLEAALDIPMQNWVDLQAQYIADKERFEQMEANQPLAHND